jgi:Cof subfamily protein (haloacid dehalogenase superfamily)
MENEIQIIITDLDKSLLNNEHQITEYTKGIFQKCIKNGIIIVFATARPLRVTKIFFISLLPNAVICHNGAVAYINEKQIYQYGIKPIMVKYLLKNIMEIFPKANLAIETNDQIYTNFDTSIIWVDNIVSKKLDVDSLPDTDIDKIIIEMENIAKIKEIKKYLPDELYLEINEGKLGLIMNKGATKWNAVKELLQYYKIEAKNAIAFGDDYNDIEMVKNCGVGVAMNNGIKEIKNIAKYVCGKNDEDGIAKWIEENIIVYGQNGI